MPGSQEIRQKSRGQDCVKGELRSQGRILPASSGSGAAAQVVFLKLKTLETGWDQVWNIWPSVCGEGICTPRPLAPGVCVRTGLVGCELQRGQEEMGLLLLTVRGEHGGKTWAPRTTFKGGGGRRELLPDGLNFLHKNQVRSFPKHQWGERKSRMENREETGRFLKFLALQCTARGWPRLGNWWFVLFLSKSDGSAKAGNSGHLFIVIDLSIMI